ncbi:hypothetical protein HRbin40_01769 [bacterium HR40]|nr:hypothetical protein HRbin40_01769 [bacterium HR40]
MTEFSRIFLSATLLAVALGFIAVWAPRRPTVKFVATGLALAFVLVGWLALADLLSRPKPVSLEWWQKRAEEATVIAGTLREGRGIYLWLRLAGSDEPRAYVLPWSRDLAQQLQQALAEAEERGGEVRMRLPFEPSWDDREPKFYALPQPALPPKDETPHNPLYYGGSEREA